MNIEFLSNKEAEKIISNLNLNTYKYNNNVMGYSDFRFLLDVDFLFDSNKFILAYDDINLYGVLKLVETTYKNKKTLGLSFIDVNKNYKRKGISKQLIKSFDDINNSPVFLSSKPCEEGKKYNIDKVIKSIANKKVIFL